MRIKFLCIIICLFVNALAFASAANRTITGVVISGEDNEPLIGASVYVHAVSQRLFLESCFFQKFQPF